MVKVIEKENLIKIDKEPIVILPLNKWEKIKEYLEELEERERFVKVFEASKGERGISLEELKKKYKL